MHLRRCGVARPRELHGTDALLRVGPRAAIRRRFGASLEHERADRIEAFDALVADAACAQMPLRVVQPGNADVLAGFDALVTDDAVECAVGRQLHAQASRRARQVDAHDRCLEARRPGREVGCVEQRCGTRERASGIGIRAEPRVHLGAGNPAGRVHPRAARDDLGIRAAVGVTTSSGFARSTFDANTSTEPRSTRSAPPNQPLDVPAAPAGPPSGGRTP